MTEKLSADFLNELFKAVLRDDHLASITATHLEYQYLPTKEYKEIWKTIKAFYDMESKVPSYGVLTEQFKRDPETMQQLSKIKTADMTGTDIVAAQLEIFIRKAMFLTLHQEMAELWDDGKHDKAYELLQERSLEIANFSLKAKPFIDVIDSFEERYTERQLQNLENMGSSSAEKARWGIEGLDESTYGGVDKGDTALITARSGVGKSKILKHIGMYNARLGKKVLHFQLEGSKKEAQDAYDTMMAGSSLSDIELTSLPESVLNKVIEASKKISGRIYIIAPEKFGALTMDDIRSYIVDFIKDHGNPDIILIDYIDEAEPAGAKRYSTNTDGEKARRSALGRNFKDLCVEFNMSGFTATQASDVKMEIWNNPNKFLTRNDVKGDKNVIDPYSYHITLNRTVDEYKNDIMRLYEDKIRKYKGGKIHRIATAYQNEKFYDRKRTAELFKDAA